MNILFATSPKTFQVHGGLSRQVHQTKAALEGLGHSIEVVTSLLHHVPSADIIHMFGASQDLEEDLSIALDQEVPVIVSTVMYSNRAASTLRRALQVQKLTQLVGWSYKPDLNAKYRLCHQATHLAPNTEAEARLIRQAFGIPPQKITVIPNGVNVGRFEHSSPELALERLGFDGFLLYVGDLEAPRKNVQTLVEVYKKEHRRLNWPPLVLMGRLGSDHPLQAQVQSDPMIHWVDAVAPDDPLLESMYRAAKTFVLPSQFETPGIAAMEAGLSQCSIAITQKGGTKDVFGSEVHYLDPFDERSISQAIHQALLSPPSDTLHATLQALDWSEVGTQTAAMYQNVILMATQTPQHNPHSTKVRTS
jgi:glycosyltransferase involved in cell wall biosynthesis